MHRNEFTKLFNTGRLMSTLLDVDIDGKHRVITRDVQVHPVTDIVLHADFLRLGKVRKSPLKCRSASSMKKLAPA